MTKKLFFVFAKTTAQLVLIIILLQSCKKSLPAKPLSAPNDAQKIRLKEVAIQGLPSPYVRFTYDTNHFVTGINHQSGAFQYDVEYKQGRIHKMINKAFMEQDTLLYYYSGQNVSRIDWVAHGNAMREQVNLKYDNKNRLIEATWKNLIQNQVVKKMLFVYNHQNNMTGCDIFYELGNGLTKTNSYQFDLFDTNENLTSNYLLNEYHFIFLPQVRLQQNNPLHATQTGTTNDFEFTYHYNYQGKLPSLKTSIMRQTRGIDSGVIRNGITRYSYEQ